MFKKLLKNDCFKILNIFKLSFDDNELGILSSSFFLN